MRLSLTLLLSIGLLVTLLVACKPLHPVYTYRFRLTVDVQKDGATHSGSSVIELRTRRQPILSMLPEVQEWETAVRGEAVFVDLGSGDHVIALLVGRNHGERGTDGLPSRAILGDKLANMGPAGLLDSLSVMHGRILEKAEGRSYALNENQMPPLIRFSRLEDPRSVERVEPTSVTARVEITQDEIRGSLRQHLPWLDRFKPDKSLSNQTLSVWKAGEKLFSQPSQITYSNFIKER